MVGKTIAKMGLPNASDIANKMYNISGMPELSVQVKILEAAETKMKYLMAYDVDVRKNLRKFNP